jgi:hypothetical protein
MVEAPAETLQSPVGEPVVLAPRLGVVVGSSEVSTTDPESPSRYDMKQQDIWGCIEKFSTSHATESDCKEIMALVEENTKRQNSKGTDTEEEDNMEKLAETGEFDIRSSIGQVFTRAHAKGTKGYNAYSNCKGWEEKREFRKRWCMDKFKDYLHSKNQSKAWSFVDETLGSYMTFGAIVQHFGGWAWAPTVQGAQMWLQSAT